MPLRFMKMDDVAAELNTTQAQGYALLRDGSLPAIKIGGRDQWRIEGSKLEEFFADAYRATAQFVADTPSARTRRSQSWTRRLVRGLTRMASRRWSDGSALRRGARQGTP